MLATNKDWSDVAEAAKDMAGNWKKFSCFGWSGKPEEHEDDYTIIYTRNRDSNCLAESNHHALVKRLQKHFEADEPDIDVERHNHWAVGWVEGFVIRVFKDGQVTEAFADFAKLMQKLSDYPVLDEEDFSNREYEESIDTIICCGKSKLVDGAPEDWASQVYSEMNCTVPESIREVEVLQKMEELGFLEIEE